MWRTGGCTGGVAVGGTLARRTSIFGGVAVGSSEVGGDEAASELERPEVAVLIGQRRARGRLWLASLGSQMSLNAEGARAVVRRAMAWR